MSEQGSIRHLRGCAAQHLERYCSPTSSWAWPSYDIDPAQGQLIPTDLLASAMLDAPVRGRLALRILHDSEGPYHELGNALAAVVSDPDARSTSFTDVELGATNGPWALGSKAFEACQRTDFIKTTTVTKILHRKLPRLIPVNDRLVREFYGVDAPWDLWGPLQRDVQASSALLDELRSSYATEDGPEMTRLRAIDIAVWMHVSEGCSGATNG